MTERTLFLALSPNNPSNTKLISQTGETLYTVVTEFSRKETVTSVRNARNELVASLEWREVLPDKVTYKNKKPVLMMEWMKKSIVPFKDHVTFTDDEGRKYRWKGNSPGWFLELYSADDNFTSAIARFHPPEPKSPLPTSAPDPGPDPAASTPSLARTLVNPSPEPADTPATLELAPRAVQIQDLVVTSFLFLERTHRMNEGRHQHLTYYDSSTPFSVYAGGDR